MRSGIVEFAGPISGHRENRAVWCNDNRADRHFPAHGSAFGLNERNFHRCRPRLYWVRHTRRRSAAHELEIERSTCQERTQPDEAAPPAT